MEQVSTPNFAHECKIRDFYTGQFNEARPHEIIVKREATFDNWPLRADLRTVDRYQVLREWEFKICADYSSLGQILTYTALMREQTNFEQVVRGVIAAFEIPPYLAKAILINNLSVELVTLPKWMAQAGNIPLINQELPIVDVPFIPRITDAAQPTG
jgi:hypothetical protein